jgi:hypothetical protein
MACTGSIEAAVLRQLFEATTIAGRFQFGGIELHRPNQRCAQKVADSSVRSAGRFSTSVTVTSRVVELSCFPDSFASYFGVSSGPILSECLAVSADGLIGVGSK